MKVLKSLLMFTFIVALVIGLTACGSSNSQSANGGDNTKSSSGTSNTNDKSAANKSTSKTSKTSNKATAKTDLHGRTITLASWSDLAPKADSILGKEMIAQQKKVEQEYDVKIKYVNAGWAKVSDKLVSSVIAGKPYADLVRLTPVWALGDSAKGLLQPVSSYASDFSKYSKTYKKTLPLKGTYYGFDNIDDGDTSGIFYNIDIMKQYGLPDPQKLAKEGKWTWSEFEKVAKQATIDTNNDGKTDVWGLAGWDVDAWAFFPESNDALFVNGKGKVDLANPKMVEALSFYQKLINRDRVWEIQPKSAPDNFQERGTFKMGHAFMTPTYEWAVSGFKNINYGFVPFPVGPHGKGFVATTSDPNGWTIPKGVKNPNVVMEIFSALHDVKPIQDYPHQTSYEKDFKRQSDINWARKVYQHQGVKHEGNYAMPTMAILKEILDKNKNVTVTLKSYQQQAQAQVHKMMNPPN